MDPSGCFKKASCSRITTYRRPPQSTQILRVNDAVTAQRVMYISRWAGARTDRHSQVSKSKLKGHFKSHFGMPVTNFPSTKVVEFAFTGAFPLSLNMSSDCILIHWVSTSNNTLRHHCNESIAKTKRILALLISNY